MMTQIEREKIRVVSMFIPNPTYGRFDSNSHKTPKKIGVVCSYQTLHTVDFIQILARHLRQVTKSLHAQTAISQQTTQRPKRHVFLGGKTRCAFDCNTQWRSVQIGRQKDRA